MTRTSKLEVDASVLMELIEFAVENELCPSTTAWTETDKMSEDCPGFISGISCKECWFNNLDVDI